MQEIWKSIEGYEGKYEISSLGRVKSLSDNKGKKREIILKPRIGKQGYLYLNLWANSKGRSSEKQEEQAFCQVKPPNIKELSKSHIVIRLCADTYTQPELGTQLYALARMKWRNNKWPNRFTA